MSALKLPVDLYSPDQLGIIILEAGNHSSVLRDAAVRVQTTGTPDAVEPLHTSALLTGILHGNGLPANDHASMEALSKGLKLIRTQAPVAHLTLAALPNRSLKRQLTEWFRKEINPYMLLTFAVRTDIGGGVVLRVGSRIYDFSFRQQIVGNKHRIAEIFENVRQ